MKEELLSTKLHIPHNRPGMVHRPRLKTQFDAILTNRLLLISAPAGFGKTSLLSEWLSDYRGSVAWISLDKGDNAPARFLRYLLSSIQMIALGAGETSGALLNSSQPGELEIEPLITLLLNELAAITNHVIIVLDDYHVIENKDIHGAVSFLIDNAPSQMHVIVSTRSDPPLPMARWQVRGQMVEIRGDDLRFSPDETRMYLIQRMGQVLSSNDIDTLGEKTEGWAAGLQMAVLSMQGRKDLSNFIRNFSGSNRYIMDYLLEEVLHRQTEEVQRFLLQTSILERLNGQLCDNVTGQTGSQQRLEILENANMFLLPLDDKRQWYRYHHLFTELLHARLLESQPGLVNTLHARAAQWYESNDMITEAINHSLAARDNERTANLIEQVTMSLIGSGELNTLLNWSEQIPREIIFARPRLCASLGWTFIFAGKMHDAEPLLDQAESQINQNELSDEMRDVMGNIAAQRAFIAGMCGDTSRAIEMARKADALLSSTNSLIRSVIPYIFARAYRLDGDMSKATEKLNEVASLARAAGSIMTLAVANYDLALILKMEGKLRQAVRIYQDTFQLATEKSTRHFGTIAKLDAGMSDLLREWNNLEAARCQATDAIERMKSWRNPADMVAAYIMLARVLQACGDLDGAAETMEKAEHIKRNTPLFSPLGTMIETDRVKLWLAQGNLAAATRWIEECHPGETGPFLVREFEQITMAQVLLDQGKPQQALEILTDLGKAAEGGGRFGKLIEILVLQAMAFKAQNNEAQALAALGKALNLAEPEGYIRIFIDAGRPMAELLFALRHRRSTDDCVHPVSKDYLTRLLAAFPATMLTGQTRLINDLSEREKEILRLMAVGMTNKQIATELFITTGTVKAHTANIYRKLDAVNRTQAIALSRELKLLQ
jgi:LuxR family maltose regulon positive regulatory protein